MPVGHPAMTLSECPSSPALRSMEAVSEQQEVVGSGKGSGITKTTVTTC